MWKNKARIATVAAMLVAVLSVKSSSEDLEAHVKKTWELKARQGIVKAVLLVDPSSSGASTLEILYDDEAHPTLEEEVGFVHEVVRQLPSIGVDIHSLRAISMRGFAEPDVARRVAVAALHSDAWRSYPRRVGGAERVVKDLLESLGAYKAFNNAIGEYGLAVTVQTVEKVATARCFDLKLGDPLCDVRSNLRVPVGANLRLAILNKSEIRDGKQQSDRPMKD